MTPLITAGGPAAPPLLIIGLPGYAEVGLLLLIVLLLFGSRLPAVARNLGRSMIEFKRGIRSEGEEEEDEPERVPPAGERERLQDGSKSPTAERQGR